MGGGGWRYLACLSVPASMGTYVPKYMVSQIKISWRDRERKTLSLISVYCHDMYIQKRLDAIQDTMSQL